MNRLPRRRWPSFTQPSTLLFNTTVTTGILYCAAVNSAFIVIAKPPSPHTATQSRSGAASFAAIAAGGAEPLPPLDDGWYTGPPPPHREECGMYRRGAPPAPPSTPPAPPAGAPAR